ncbi:signal peptidase I [Paenibacillus sp. GD4]|uniref:signal peptidase I n=1 Tax=Paenibacillus sp. GD4 TaxID=3068890 RepID=UPI0027967344|nr:signal peptidase I [Paenibacillus sp. GD4]MDQ1910417.1 signal peptidase I [Paenibacillus sp. GD4]
MKALSRSFAAWIWLSMQINAKALKQLVRERGYIELPSIGTSMSPAIREGYVCRFTDIEARSLKVGDIVLFVGVTGELVGHRLIGTLVKEGKAYYVCKGDSNRTSDRPVPEEQLIGRMVSVRAGQRLIRADALSMRMWGWLVSRLPFVSLCVHYSVRLHNKTRGRRAGSYIC